MLIYYGFSMKNMKYSGNFMWSLQRIFRTIPLFPCVPGETASGVYQAGSGVWYGVSLEFGCFMENDAGVVFLCDVEHPFAFGEEDGVTLFVFRNNR